MKKIGILQLDCLLLRIVRSGLLCLWIQLQQRNGL